MEAGIHYYALIRNKRQGGEIRIYIEISNL